MPKIEDIEMNVFRAPFAVSVQPNIQRSQPIDIPNSREIPVPGTDGYLGDGHFVGSLPSENQGVDWRLAHVDPKLYDEQINAFFHMEMHANNSDLAPEN